MSAETFGSEDTASGENLVGLNTKIQHGRVRQSVSTDLGPYEDHQCSNHQQNHHQCSDHQQNHHLQSQNLLSEFDPDREPEAAPWVHFTEKKESAFPDAPWRRGRRERTPSESVSASSPVDLGSLA